MSQCWLVSAIVEHEMSIRDASMVFVSDPADPLVIALSNNTTPYAADPDVDHPVTIGNVAASGQTYFEVDVAFMSTPGTKDDFFWDGNSIFAQQVVKVSEPMGEHV